MAAKCETETKGATPDETKTIKGLEAVEMSRDSREINSSAPSAEWKTRVRYHSPPRCSHSLSHISSFR